MAFVCGGPYIEGHDEFGLELLADCLSTMEKPGKLILKQIPACMTI